MEYISTRNTQKIFSFKDVFLKGLAPDGGLFVPKKIPIYNSQELEKLRNLSYEELATKIILKFCSDEFDEIEIKDLVKNSYKNFRVNDVVVIKKIGKEKKYTMILEQKVVLYHDQENDLTTLATKTYDRTNK